jgi:pyruvate/2-oxoglutarate dehydrogenase complex dihydrolipoamide dehydrogenase (E3) component
MADRYDSLVFGGGMAGLPLALRAARHGRVAFVEKETLGGTCLNRGCIPTKTMIASAAVAHQVRRAAEFGVHTPGPVTVDLPEVVDRKDRMVGSIRGLLPDRRKGRRHRLLPAPGVFTAKHQLTVDGTDLVADKIFLATGMRTAIPAITGLDAVPYYTSRTLLDATELPTHLLVVEAATSAASSRSCSPASARKSL